MARIHHKTLQDLEFPAVLQKIAEYCLSNAGSEHVLHIKPSTVLNKVEHTLDEVNEFKVSFTGDNPIPNHGFESIDKELKTLEIEGTILEVPSFRKLKSVSESTATLQKFFYKYKEFYVRLYQQSASVDYTSEVEKAVQQVINRFGDIKDDASPELQRIRQQISGMKSKINASFTVALSRSAAQEYLDEIKESVIENRRVLAVKAMYRKKVKGAMMGTSKTGSIVFIEPETTLNLSRELHNLLFEEKEEIKRILKELTEFVRPYKDFLKSYQTYLITIDVISAKAKYAQKINAVKPLLSRDKKLDLIDAYHPILLESNNAKKEKTYPQSIALLPNKRIIVISGPNAGGKSITLKTVGLLQLMLQSGILIPVDAKSEVCFFNKILTDIGDNQSIENHLSTYSYRLKMMNTFLKKCDEHTLFLIDEFGTGSDPELGGALAETFLEVFYEREAFGIITTHYTNLKMLADELPNAVNANMQFDQKNLQPLYQLFIGEAGSSFTFEVAQKNGIPYSLINRAKKKIERSKVRFDKTIANLQKERSKLRKTTTSLETEEQKAKEEAKQLAEINQKIQQKLESYQELYDSNQKYIQLGKKLDALGESFLNNKRKKQLFDEVFKLVSVENAKRSKKAPKARKKEKTEEKKIEKEVAQKVAVIRKEKKKEKAEAKKIEENKPKVKLMVGDRVRMTDGKSVGTIDTIEKNKAIVNYGLFTTNVSVDALEFVERPKTKK